MRYKPRSIEEVGLKKHLDQTKKQHNNFDYQAFVTMMWQDLTKSNIARAYGVNVKTVTKWIEIYGKEKDGAA